MPSVKKFSVTERTKLFKDSTATAVILQLEIGDIVTEAREGEDDFIEVVFITPAGKMRSGFVRRNHVENLEAEPRREDFDEEGFVEICMVAERTINNDPQTAPWFVAADFIIARAILETKLKNLGQLTAGSDAVGPLQVSSAEWQRFLDGGAPFAEGMEHLRDDPVQQIWGATYRMRIDAEGITKCRLEKGTGKKDDPPLASYLEVYFAYLTDNVEAAVKISDAEASESEKGKDVAQVVQGVLESPEIAALQDKVQRITGKPAPVKTGEFVAAVETALNLALRKAYERIKKFTPPELLTGSGPAPWLNVARNEAKDKVKEPDERILDYFKSINFDTTTTKTPWCAAFVSFCVKTSGNAKAAASVPTSAAALAATWRNWGGPLPLNADDTPQGAVVVLKPTEAGDGSGHVAFFVRGDAGSVTLLGGNQSDSVNESTYRRSRIVAIRWLDVAPAQDIPVLGGSGNVAGFTLPSNIPAARKRFADMIVAAFAAAGYSKVQQIAALANAIGESGLNPDAHAPGEDSVGLFQLRRKGGVGGNNSVEALKDPAFNIKLIIAETKRVSPSFKSATTIEEAVTAFVRDVERPANPNADAQKRIVIARTLIA